MHAVDADTLLGMLEHAPGFICLTDTKANIRYLNRTGSGYRMEDVMGRSWYDFCSPEQAEVCRRGFEKVLATGEPQDTEHFLDSPDGKRCWFLTRIAPLRGDGSEVSGLVTIITDITEKRDAEERLKALDRERVEDALRTHASRTEKILDTAIDGYLLIDSDTTIIDVNDAYCNLTGRKRAEVLGTKLSRVAATASGEPSLGERLASLLATRGKLRFELTHETSDGSIIELEASGSVLHLHDNPLVVLFVRDVSARRRAEEERERLEAQLHQQQKLQSLGTLASGVAHEINNPIQGILGFAQLIRHRTSSDDDVRKFASEIVIECKRIAGIVNDLLTFAREEKERRTPARIDEVINATLSLIRSTLESDAILVDVLVPEGLAYVSCRSHKIQQVLMNLLTNARDALNERYPGMHPDKRIRIVADEFERQGAEWVRIVVEDSGMGIDPAIMARIFDPFFTTKHGNAGTGLGLSVSHGIVREHRGELHVESEYGRYARFSVELPIEDESLHAAPAPAQAERRA
jgi:PAS domain S-box-containing protein